MKHTKESIHFEALKYNSRSEFEKFAPSIYLAARRKRLLDVVCSHMKGRFIWTIDLLKTEALKYNSKKEFETNNLPAYSSAYKKGILNDICSHMTNGLKFWSDQMLYDEALNYSNKSEFEQKNSTAYNLSLRRGIIDKVCSHMINKYVYRTDEDIRNEALKYTNRYEFQKKDIASYTCAYKRRIIDKVCSHMISKNIGGFNPDIPAILYYIKFESCLDKPLYKIGITNHEDIKIRIDGMRLNNSFSYKILKQYWFYIGEEARYLETILKSHFKEYRYFGDPIMNNGNSELFVEDIFSLLI